MQASVSLHDMILAALLLHAFPFTSLAAAIPVKRAESPEEAPFNTNYRSTTDIIWSCIVTVFACTWLSVHPNVSGSQTTWKQRMKHRIYLMLWGVAAPEFLVIFAYRQWRGSRDITRAIRRVVEDDKLDLPSGRTWTDTHSHFLQMGGFMFQDPNAEETAAFIEVKELVKDPQGVGREALCVLLKSSPTEDEIWDKSKGDTLAKAIVAFQTGWFLAQIIGRAAQRLTITELEIITLAYAAFNAAMYAFWWDKPLDVQCPLLVPFPDVQELRLYRTNSVVTQTGLSFIYSELYSTSENPSPIASLPTAHLHPSRRHHGVDVVIPQSEQIAPVQREIPTNVQSAPTLFICACNKVLQFMQRPLSIMHRVYILTGFKRPGKDYVFSVFDHRTPSKTSRRQGPRQEHTRDPQKVPTFYTYSEASDIAPRSIAVSAFAMFLASCFGAAHCIAWTFSCLTEAEAVLWRVCALLICLSPIVSFITFLVATWYSWLLQGPAHWRLFVTVKTLVLKVLAPFHNNIFIPILLPSYLVARLILIGLAFAQLRKLSKDTHQTVEWSDFLPHI